MAFDNRVEIKSTGQDVEEIDSGSGTGEKTIFSEHTSETRVDRRSAIHSLERYINLPSAAFFALIVLCSWESFGVSFQFALLNGGRPSMFYGGLLACIGECLVAFSLAELASIDPTVGAQYRWTANLAPAFPRFWGLLQGWITTSGWAFACAGPASILSNMITSMAIFNYEGYEPERWHTSLIMIATMIVPLVTNLWFRRVLDTFEISGGVLHIVLFIVFMAIILAMGVRNGDTHSALNTLTWEASGWNNKGVSFGLGMLPTTFALTGCDSVLHMSDEVKQVRTRVPRSMVLSVVLNSVMMMAFIIALLFHLNITDDQMNSGLPLLYVIYNATGSKPVTNLLFALILILLFFCAFNIFASVSRLIWVFAQDKGLPFSNVFSYVHPTLKLPVNALILVGCVVTCLSLIYIASATAFNALISLQTLALHVSYFLPILFMLIRKIRGPTPPPYGPFRLGAFGLPVNIFSLCYLVYVIVWMPFPQLLPVTKDNMNYAAPIFGAVVVGALIDWFVSGRKRFEMPMMRYE